MNNCLSEQLEEAKSRLDIPALWEKLNLPGHPPKGGRACKSPFRQERHPSFSVYGGGRKFRDHGTGQGGDVVEFLRLATGLSGKALFDELHRLAGLPRRETREETTRAPLSPEQRARAERRRLEREEKRRLQAIAEAARRQAERIFSIDWTPADCWHDSPVILEADTPDRRLLLERLYGPDDVIWTGIVSESGPGHENRFRRRDAWLDAPDAGPMICPDVFQPGVCSRSGDHVAASPFIIIEADATLGRKPVTAEERAENVRRNLAVIRWLKEDLKWTLRAVVFTGGKSVHGWFERPPEGHVRELKAIASVLGIDTNVFAPAHPVRLPEVRHGETGNLSRLLWLA